MVTFNVGKTKILLQREFRPATNRWVYNFPAGLIDEGETALEAAKREVTEETGLKVVKVDAVLSPSFASQGTSDELMQIVICECEGEISGSIYAEEELPIVLQGTLWQRKAQVSCVEGRRMRQGVV